jgi:hypothetical protein
MVLSRAVSRGCAPAVLSDVSRCLRTAGLPLPLNGNVSSAKLLNPLSRLLQPALSSHPFLVLFLRYNHGIVLGLLQCVQKECLRRLQFSPTVPEVRTRLLR